MQDDKVTINLKTLRKVMDTYLDLCLHPAMQRELGTFLETMENRSAMIREVSMIVGYPVSGSLGGINMEQHTRLMVDTIVSIMANDPDKRVEEIRKGIKKVVNNKDVKF